MLDGGDCGQKVGISVEIPLTASRGGEPLAERDLDTSAINEEKGTDGHAGALSD
jgi:hypothetical protein